MSHIVMDARIINTSTGRYMERLLHYLQQLDQKNRYSVIIRDAEHWQPSADNFEVVVAEIPDFSFAEQLQLLKIVRDLKPDLVHFTMPQFPLLLDFLNIPRINTIHDLTMVEHSHPHWNFVFDAIKRLVFRVVMRRAARADYVITPTRFVKNQIVARYPVDPSNVVVTYESADRLSVGPKRYDDLKRKKFIMYAGNIFPYKNVQRLLEAFDLLKIKHPDLHLAIVGKEKRFHRKMRAVVKQLGVKHVVFTGFIPDAQLAWLYENAEAYVFPSLSEGFGLPGIEAMLYDCPLVSSNASCLPEVYGDAAHYFDPLDVEDMARAIDDVLTKSNLRKDLILQGNEVAAKYSWERMAQQTLKTYEKALS